MCVVPVPVAFQVEPVLSFNVRVGSLLKPPAELKQYFFKKYNHITEGLKKIRLNKTPQNYMTLALLVQRKLYQTTACSEVSASEQLY